MNERSGSHHESLPLTPKDFVMQIRGYFEDMVGHPEFQTWKTALDDVVELRAVEEQKKRIVRKDDVATTVWSKAESAKTGLLAQWKREDAKVKAGDPEYKFAFTLMTITAMNLEYMYRDQREKDPTRAADKELKQLKEYVARLV